MPCSFHTHSGQFCRHASGKLEDVVLRAIALGFSHLGLSEHAPRTHESDLYQEEREANLTPADLGSTFESYVKEAKRLQAAYQDQIRIVVGMETEFIRDEDAQRTSALVAQYQLEYVVGSVHHVNGVPIDYSQALFDEAVTRAGSIEQCFLDYFDHQYNVIRAVRPQVIGHVDVIRLFCQDFPFTDLIWAKVQRNLDFAISYGALFEVNCRSLKKRFPDPYPQRDILQRIIAGGGKFTLCDDSHGPNDVAMFYLQGYEYLQQWNISKIYVLEVDDIGKPAKVATLKNWQDHVAWQRLRTLST